LVNNNVKIIKDYCIVFPNYERCAERRRKSIALNASAACQSDHVIAQATIRKSIALNAIIFNYLNVIIYQ